jgi:hypothetical protein
MEMLVSAIVLFTGCTLASAQNSRAESMVEALKKMAKPGWGISVEQQQMARKVQSIGAEAVPYLDRGEVLLANK